MTNFEIAHANAIKAMHELMEVWSYEQANNYPKYLPSFDEFVADFDSLITKKI